MQHICSNSQEIHWLRRVNIATKRNNRLDCSILKVFILLLLKQWIQMTVGYCVKVIIFSHPHCPITIANPSNKSTSLDVLDTFWLDDLTRSGETSWVRWVCWLLVTYPALMARTFWRYVGRRYQHFWTTRSTETSRDVTGTSGIYVLQRPRATFLLCAGFCSSSS